MDFKDLLQRYRLVFPSLDLSFPKVDDPNFILSYEHYLTYYIEQYAQLAQMSSNILDQNSDQNLREIQFFQNVIAPLRDNPSFEELKEKEDSIADYTGKSE